MPKTDEPELLKLVHDSVLFWVQDDMFDWNAIYILNGTLSEAIRRYETKEKQAK